MPKWFIGPNVSSDKVMTPTEAAYMAAFIDGEGTIGIYKAKRGANRSGYRLQPAIAMNNTHFGVLQRLREMCGNGRLLQQTNPLKPHHKTGYALRLYPNQIRHVLPQIRPYLIVKAQQADYLMQFLSITRQTKGRTQEELDREMALRDAVCQLNAKGVATVQ